jgi:nicotinate-nucleotide adenylyltransferase
MRGSLAVYGGTFDPVHYGHLRSAIEIRQALCVDTVCLVPSYMPPHRQQPDSTPEQRLEMLRLAIDEHAGLRIDDREIKRKGPSFMVETLESIRQEVGSDVSLSLVLGSDAYAIFNEWRRWQDIVDIAHLVVLERPGYALDDVPQSLRGWSMPRWVESPQELLKTAAGKMTRLKVTQLEISASMIRNQINVGLAIDYLLPEKVQDYIRRQKLYSTP